MGFGIDCSVSDRVKIYTEGQEGKKLLSFAMEASPKFRAQQNI